MRFTLPRKKTEQSGFTLIEILIIAPVVVLVISGFVALMITLVGDVLTTRDQTAMAFETQDALDRIEQDTRLTTQFLDTSGTQIAPQGSNANFTGTDAFTSTNTLIMGGLATDKNPIDTSRQLIYYAKQPYDCGTQQQIYNRVFQAKIIYFIKDGSLWRRVILPNYNTNASPNDDTVCSVPWQRNSCSPGYGGGTRCETNDTEIMKNVSSFSVKYYETPKSTTELGSANAPNASTIEVTIAGSKGVVGRTITNSGVVRATKLNNIDVEIPAPGTPNIVPQISGNSIIFSWTPVPLATSYNVTYLINGVSQPPATLNAQTTSFTVNANRNDTITMSVSAHNATGDSPAHTVSATIPPWFDCVLQNYWQNYYNGYATAGYTKTSADVVVLKGLVWGGTATANVPICTLPVGFRPDKRLIFATSSQNGAVSGAGRIDIATNGEVRFSAGTNGWISLDGLRFTASGASISWSSPAMPTWTDYTGAPNDTAPHQVGLDTLGRVHVRGVIVPGTTTAGATIFNLPAGTTRSTQFTYLPSAGATGFNWNGYGGIIDARLNPGTWMSLQAMFYPGNATGWTSMTTPTNIMGSGWAFLGAANHATPEYRKSADGIVTLKGMVTNATQHDGTTIATLPPGFRPKEQLLTSCVAWGGYCRVDILPDGKIVDNASANNGWLSLDNISFMAEQ